MMRVVKELARSKINYFLRVSRRRDDGYHELESLIVPTSLADEVVAREADGIALAVAAGDGFGETPSGPDNLVVVAALALAEVARPPHGASISLKKNIPVAAGLGGGSADAAAVLHALNDLWGCGLSLEALSVLGASIGSDIPALLADGATLVRGRGELVEPVHLPPSLWVVVPMDFPVRTPDAFGWWDEEGGHVQEAGDIAGDIDGVLAAARAGAVDELAACMFNDLEAAVIRRHPIIVETQQRLVDAGALGAIMCGSGPTVAALTSGVMADAVRIAALFPRARVAIAPALRSQVQWEGTDRIEQG